MNQKNKNGFTLIESMVVVAIIGTLATIVLVAMVSGIRKSRDSQRKKDIATIVSAMEQYREKNGCYPSNTNSGIITSAGTLARTLFPFLQITPQDPTHDGVTYYYAYDACNGTRAIIGAKKLDIAPTDREINSGDHGLNTASFNRRLDGCGCP
jgi:prepilin-type N-terminal cleavage/methylation domain-containing protein